MRPVTRRRVLQGLAGAAGLAALRLVAAQADAAPRRIEITARRFVYEPAQIPLRVGERVVIAVRSIDFIHGMNLPDLGQRYDLVPGRITQFELQPAKPGVIDFLCDNFCGDGHEQMNGRFVVTA